MNAPEGNDRAAKLLALCPTPAPGEGEAGDRMANGGSSAGTPPTRPPPSSRAVASSAIPMGGCGMVTAQAINAHRWVAQG